MIDLHNAVYLTEIILQKDGKYSVFLRIMDSNSIADRILSVRGPRKQSDFARELDVNPNTLRAYEKGRATPGQDFLERLAVKFSVNPEWLLLGRGEMHLRSGASGPGAPGPNPGRESRPEPSGHAAVPVIGLATCGYQGWFNPNDIALNTAIAAGDARPGMFAVIAIGPSMQPEGIRHGFVVICDPNLTPRKGDVVYVERRDLEEGTVHASLKLFISRDEDWAYLASWSEPDQDGRQEMEFAELSTRYLGRLVVASMVKRRA